MLRERGRERREEREREREREREEHFTALAEVSAKGTMISFPVLSRYLHRELIVT